MNYSSKDTKIEHLNNIKKERKTSNSLLKLEKEKYKTT